MIKLNDIMSFAQHTMVEMRVPAPGRELPVGIDAPASAIAHHIGVVGGYLAYLEYHIGAFEAMRLTLDRVVDYSVMDQLPATDPKATVKAREASIIAGDSSIRIAITDRSKYEHLMEIIKGYRNGYRAQYDALSRMLSAKQLEAEVSRG